MVTEAVVLLTEMEPAGEQESLYEQDPPPIDFEGAFQRAASKMQPAGSSDGATESTIDFLAMMKAERGRAENLGPDTALKVRQSTAKPSGLSITPERRAFASSRSPLFLVLSSPLP